jgi:hypothetical protein
MTDTQIEMALQEWWKDSFPMAPLNKQTGVNMVAFASHVLPIAGPGWWIRLMSGWWDRLRWMCG